MVKIFVGNLNSKTKAADLRKRFEKYGDVRECDIVNNYAFVHMDNESEVKEAISNLHESELDGTKINVERSHGKKDRGGGPMRRRDEGRRGGRGGFRGPPRGYMGGPGGPGPRGDRFGGPGGRGGWDGPYSQPPMRNMDRGYGYPQGGDRYGGDPMRRDSRGPPMRDSYPDNGYGRGMPPREPMPPRDAMPPPRDYKEPRGRYDSYDSYGGGRGGGGGYDYRDSGAQAPRNNDYYDGYGSSAPGGGASGGYGNGQIPSSGSYDYPDYRDSRSTGAQMSQQSAPSYDSNYDYGSYYDYGRDSRADQAPGSRQAYGYGRS